MFNYNLKLNYITVYFLIKCYNRMIQNLYNLINYDQKFR